MHTPRQTHTHTHLIQSDGEAGHPGTKKDYPTDSTTKEEGLSGGGGMSHPNVRRIYVFIMIWGLATSIWSSTVLSVWLYQLAGENKEVVRDSRAYQRPSKHLSYLRGCICSFFLSQILRLIFFFCYHWALFFLVPPPATGPALPPSPFHFLLSLPPPFVESNVHAALGLAFLWPTRQGYVTASQGVASLLAALPLG